MIVIGQVGSTIGLGLLFDTLVVRSLDDAVDRRTDGPVVLVAAARASAAETAGPGPKPVRAVRRR